jgi:23S rRNA (adenine2503-C2)-methyltransferase
MADVKDGRVNLKEMTLEEMTGFVLGIREKGFRAKQMYQWVFEKGVSSIDEMHNLSRDFRSLLKGKACIAALETLEVKESSDGSKKYLFGLDDDRVIESVSMPDPKGLTICISSQVGCRFGCKFCLTGRGGFTRDLKSWEIIDQVLSIKRDINEKSLNVVIMGMGEPLSNYDNVIKAVKQMTAKEGMNISPRRITLSTSGWIPGLKRLKKEKLSINIAVSLNAADNETRSRLMPISKKYPLDELLQACYEYPLADRKRLTFEYVLIRDVNDSIEDAARLAKLLQGLRCKINLIPFNPFKESSFKTPTAKRILAFQNHLIKKKFTVTQRKSRGFDIGGGCGHLRSSFIKSAPEKRKGISIPQKA